MDATERKINTLDFQTLSPEDRGSFMIALGNLKQAVQNRLDKEGLSTEQKSGMKMVGGVVSSLIISYS